MDAIEIFKQLIGEKIKPMIIKYEPYKYVFTTHPYSHILDVNFEERFTDTVFDSILFYAYEKDEIEKEYQKGHLDDLRKLLVWHTKIVFPKPKKKQMDCWEN